MVPNMEVSCCIDQDFSRVGLPAPRPLYEVDHLGSPSPAMWAAVLPASTGRVEPAPQARSRASSGPGRAGFPARGPWYELDHLGSPSPAMWAAVLPASTGRVEPAPQARSRARSGPVRARACLVSDSADSLVVRSVQTVRQSGQS